MHIDGIDPVLSKQYQADALYLWNHSAISILDIRHKIISPKESLRFWRLPASAFLYTVGNRAKVSLDDSLYNEERFGLFHGGRGTELSICPMEDCLEYYMIFYKAEEPAAKVKEYLRLLGRNNPYRQQYGFAPSNPLYFAEQLRKMYERWKGPTPLDLFYGKTAFYQLVYEVYEEMDRGSIQMIEPDVVGMAKRYLDRHSREPITIHEISEVFGISHSHLHRIFKRQTGKSPQEYLMNVRLTTAKACLRNSQASVREIAEHCGFQDERSFRRLFLKYAGVNPSAYREKTPLQMSDIALENVTLFPYNEKGRVSHGKLKVEGENYMFKQMKSKAIVAAAVSLMLLLTACSTTPTNTGSKKTTPSKAVAAQAVKTGTRTVTVNGKKIEVPANPQRIVITGYTFGDVLAFGHTIVGTEAWAPVEDEKTSKEWSDMWLDKAGSPAIVSFDNPEQILALKPDLIIAETDLRKGDPEKLKAIAPTVLYNQRGMTMEERLTLLGEVLGEQKKAQELIHKYTAKVDAAKQKLSAAGLLDKKIVFAQGIEDGEVYVHGEKNRGLVYTSLGMHAPAPIEQLVFSTVNPKADGHAAELSLETAPKYLTDADIIAYTSFDDTYETTAQKLSEVEIWNSIPAVKSGNVFYYSVSGPLSKYDYSNSMAALDIFVNALLALPIAK